MYINCILIEMYLLAFSIDKIALGPPILQKYWGATARLAARRLWKPTSYARKLTHPNKNSWLRPWCMNISPILTLIKRDGIHGTILKNYLGIFEQLFKPRISSFTNLKSLLQYWKFSKGMEAGKCHSNSKKRGKDYIKN